MKPAVTITISGPAGTGKSTIARFIAEVLRSHADASVELYDAGELQAVRSDAVTESSKEGREAVRRAQWVIRTSNAEGSASNASTDVFAERHRQIESEGWTPAHDDAHDPGELAAAGSAYALNAADQLHPLSQGDGGNAQPLAWPWAPEWWKPTTPRRDLVKAAALIIAEIERMDRSAGGS